MILVGASSPEQTRQALEKKYSNSFSSEHRQYFVQLTIVENIHLTFKGKARWIYIAFAGAGHFFGAV
jgi:hypothetical protein